MERRWLTPWARRRPADEIGDATGEQPRAASPAMRLEAHNLAVLAQALAATTMARPPALLQHAPVESRLASLDDFARPWFGYWLGELSSPCEPTRLTWARALTLQMLYEAGALACGRTVALAPDRDHALQAYLRGLGVIVGPAPAEAASGLDAVVRQSGADEATLFSDLDSVRPGGLLLHIVDYVVHHDAAGEAGDGAWTKARCERLVQRLWKQGHKPAPLNLSSGRHALDGFVATSGAPGGLDINLDGEDGVTTPLIVLVERGG